jgi:diguanylate cyclase (GGDEF)-like protein/PAS domain S-box-containing protein
MTAILRQFAGLADEDFDVGIQDALASIGRFAGVDRSYLFLIDGAYMDNTHEWCAPGIQPEIENLQQVPFDTIAWWQPRLRRGESIYIPSVAALPKERAAERELLAAQGIQSLIVVPLMGPEQLHGFIGFDSVRRPRSWAEPAKLLLRAVADTLIGALLRRDALAALQQSERRFRTLVRRSSDVVMILDADGGLRYLGPSALSILGWDDHCSSPKRYLDAVHPEDRELVSDALVRAVEAKGEHITIGDHRLRCCGDDSYIWCQTTATDLRDDHAIAGIVINAHDISRRKEAERELQHRAMHDALTSLPNRALLDDRLEQLLLHKQRFGGQVGVVFIDLDNFKLVNDSVGHRAGDQLLLDAATRLSDEIALGDTVARFGGDEFVILLDGGEQRTPASMVREAERLLEVLTHPFRVAGRAYSITASAGLAVSNGFASPHDLLRDADAAMYQAKYKGGARLQCFDAPLRARLLARVDMEHDLRGSETRGELSLLYQGVFNVHDLKLRGSEALLRWTHPQRGSVSPGEFIPVAEETGLIVPIGLWALDSALQQLRSWIDGFESAAEMTLAINLSARQLVAPGLALQIETALNRHRIPAAKLALELTESAVMNEIESGTRALHDLRELGVTLAIDDFGTGYSSLAYLRDLPIDVLKIDRSFVDAMLRSERDRHIIAVITALGQKLGMTTVAEGVEHEAQLRTLRVLGCDRVQGFHLMRPEPPAAMAQRLTIIDAERLATV